jgi:TM2 domain-containing membrane protein YozV
MLLIAILFPWLSFFLRGKIIQGIICLVLQITLIGWLPATFWAVSSRSEAKADKRARDLINQMQNNQK